MSSPNQGSVNDPPAPAPETPKTFKDRVKSVFNFEYFKTLHFVLKVLIIVKKEYFFKLNFFIFY